MRRSWLAGLLLLAACSREAPSPPTPALPTFRDASGEGECGCVERGRCPVADAFEGESRDRGFQCRWEDRGAALAACRYESRFRPAAPAGAGWTAWSETRLRFRRARGGKGWCWFERSQAR